MWVEALLMSSVAVGQNACSLTVYPGPTVVYFDAFILLNGCFALTLKKVDSFIRISWAARHLAVMQQIQMQIQ